MPHRHQQRFIWAQDPLVLLLCALIVSTAAVCMAAPASITTAGRQPTTAANSSIAKCCSEKGVPGQLNGDEACSQDPFLPGVPDSQLDTFAAKINAREFLGGNKTTVREYLSCVLSGGTGTFAPNVTKCCAEKTSFHSQRCPLELLCDDTGLLLTDTAQWSRMFGGCSASQMLLVGHCFRYGRLIDSKLDENSNTTTGIITPDKTHPLLAIIPGLPPWAHILLWAALLLLGVGLLGLVAWMIVRCVTAIRRRDENRAPAPPRNTDDWSLPKDTDSITIDVSGGRKDDDQPPVDDEPADHHQAEEMLDEGEEKLEVEEEPEPTPANNLRDVDDTEPELEPVAQLVEDEEAQEEKEEAGPSTSSNTNNRPQPPPPPPRPPPNSKQVWKPAGHHC